MGERSKEQRQERLSHSDPLLVLRVRNSGVCRTVFRTNELFHSRAPPLGAARPIVLTLQGLHFPVSPPNDNVKY
jgi:hypothetical protein